MYAVEEVYLCIESTALIDTNGVETSVMQVILDKVKIILPTVMHVTVPTIPSV